MRHAAALHFPWLDFTKTNQELHAFWDKLWAPEPRPPKSPGSFASAFLMEDPENVVLFAEWLRAEGDMTTIPANPPRKSAASPIRDPNCR